MTVGIYKSTPARPFGFLRNFEWWIFYGFIGHKNIWLRAGSIPYGVSITKQTPLNGWLVFRDWSIRINRAKE